MKGFFKEKPSANDLLFKKYTQEKLFPYDHFKLLTEFISESKGNNKVGKPKVLPDFHFYSNISKKRFFIQCKFLEDKNPDGTYNWCSDEQFQRFIEIDKVISPVYLVIGTGKFADIPKAVYLVPLKTIKEVSILPDLLKKYELRMGDPELKKAVHEVLKI